MNLRLQTPNSGWRPPAKLALRVVQQRLGINRPLSATFLVTDRCNVRCDGCVYYGNHSDHIDNSEEGTERAIAILDALAAEGIPVVAIAGGEPFLRRDLHVLLREAGRRRFSLSVITNGLVDNPDALQAVDEVCDALLFSPHVASELGPHGAAQYERGWQGFARMRAALRRPALVCMLVISKHTAPLLDEIVGRALDLGADQIRYQPNFYRDQFPTPEQVAACQTTLRRYAHTHPGRLTDARLFLDHLADYFAAAPAVPCTANRRFNIGVYVDGTVTACCPQYVPIGNIFAQPLSDMLQARLEEKHDCFGCHRVDVLRALELCGRA